MRHRQFRKIGVGDEQRIAHARDLHRIGQFADAAGTEAHRGGVVPIGAQVHHTARRWKLFGRVSISYPIFDKAAPRPVSLMPVQASAGIEIVAAVHIHGAGLDFAADPLGSVHVLGPDRCGKTVGRVIHQPDGFLVVANFHDADHRTEGLFHHDLHAVVDIDQYLRRDVGRTGAIFRKGLGIDQRAGALLHRLGDMITHGRGKTLLRHRAERGVGIERIVQHVLFR